MKIDYYDYQRDVQLCEIIVNLSNTNSYGTHHSSKSLEYKSDGLIVFYKDSPREYISFYSSGEEIEIKKLEIDKNDLLSEESYFQYSTIYTALDLHVLFIFQYLKHKQINDISIPMKIIWDLYEKLHLY